MIHLVNDDIFISGFRAFDDPSWVEVEGVRAVLCLDGAHADLKEKLPQQVVHKCVPIHDGPATTLQEFLGAVDTLARLTQSHSPVLVHCHAGASRTPAVVIGYLVKHRGYAFELARASLGHLPQVSINPALLRLIRMVADTQLG